MRIESNYLPLQSNGLLAVRRNELMGSMRMVTLVVVICNKTVFKHNDVMKNSDSLSRSVTYKLSLLQRLILDSKNANENNKE